MLFRSRNIALRCFDPETADAKDMEYGEDGVDSKGHKHWIVPANPKYYDIVTEFDANDETDWKQGKGVEAGDIVYFYVGAPWSAILYKGMVTRTHIPFQGKAHESVNISELMEIKVLERYNKTAFKLNGVMSEYGVRYVRGPRFMPPDLERYIEKHHKKLLQSDS